jgi:hypothetical protein
MWFGMATACMNQASIEAETPTCTPASSSNGGVYDLQAADRQVTFYKDLLPILTSNSEGKNYKCTTCHAHMNQPEGLNSVAKVEDSIRSMRNGTMPRSNSRVTEEEIQLFDLWRLQGFQPGDPSDTPPADATPKTNSAQSTNCPD